MKTRCALALAIVVVACLVLMSAPARAAAVGEMKGTTLENLQAAFNGESNAHAKYLLFAKKADEEGYKGVATLFRAAARAEEVHAAEHAKVIKTLGAEPKAEIKTPEVKTTRENLQAAIAGETYERDTMYPTFIEKAKAEKVMKAQRSFNLAKTAEAEHAKLYKEALDNLDSWKTGRSFFVCSVCGYTVKSIDDMKKCPSCFSPKEKYEKIS